MDTEIYVGTGLNWSRYGGGPQESGPGNSVFGKIDKDSERICRSRVPYVLDLEIPGDDFTRIAGLKI